MHTLLSRPFRHAVTCLAAALLAAPLVASAQDANAIRKNLAERLPNLPPVDEITKTQLPGIYEIRLGSDVLYTDEKGSYVIEGHIMETATRTDLTAERLDKLSMIDFSKLPLKDAVVWKKGNGKRKLAVFADPNCGYCKRFEHTLQDIDNVTVYTFIIPILGGDSPEKSRAIWCSKDNTTAWRNWMLDGKAPPRTMGACDASAIDRNVAIAKKYRVNGTPGVVFEDGRRAPGAVPADEVEKGFARAAAKG